MTEQEYRSELLSMGFPAEKLTGAESEARASAIDALEDEIENGMIDLETAYEQGREIMIDMIAAKYNETGEWTFEVWS